MSALARIHPEPHRFTFEQARVLVDSGTLGDAPRLELLDGELIDMPSEGFGHASLKTLLANYLTRALGPEWLIAADTTMQLSLFDAPEPDIYVVERARFAFPVEPSTVPLLIEVAVTSQDHDLRRKRRKYAQYGFVEYWVVDQAEGCTQVFGPPMDGLYPDPTRVPFDAVLTPRRLPEAAVRIADLLG